MLVAGSQFDDYIEVPLGAEGNKSAKLKPEEVREHHHNVRMREVPMTPRASALPEKLSVERHQQGIGPATYHSFRSRSSVHPAWPQRAAFTVRRSLRSRVAQTHRSIYISLTCVPLLVCATTAFYMAK